MPLDGRRPTDPTRLRADLRERALGRLSRLTTAAAIGGTFATVGFGGLAAMTYSGTPVIADPISIDDTAPQGQVQSTQPNGTSPSATRAPTTNQQVVPAQPPTVTTRRRTHVSSGGSG
jgi:hypothetical protein